MSELDDAIGEATEKIEIQLFVPRDRQACGFYSFVARLSVKGVWAAEAREILSDLLLALKTREYNKFRSKHSRYEADLDLVRTVLVRGEPDFSCSVASDGTLSISVSSVRILN